MGREEGIYLLITCSSCFMKGKLWSNSPQKWGQHDKNYHDAKRQDPNLAVWTSWPPLASSWFANYTMMRLDHANWLGARTQDSPADYWAAVPSRPDPLSNPVLGICVSNLGPEIWIVGVCQWGAVGRGCGGVSTNGVKYGGEGREKRF